MQILHSSDKLKGTAINGRLGIFNLCSKTLKQPPYMYLLTFVHQFK